MKQLIAYVLAGVLWVVAIKLMAHSFPWVFVVLLALHAVELACVGWRVGRAAGMVPLCGGGIWRESMVPSVVLCLTFGFLWWLPKKRLMDADELGEKDFIEDGLEPWREMGADEILASRRTEAGIDCNNSQNSQHDDIVENDATRSPDTAAATHALTTACVSNSSNEANSSRAASSSQEAGAPRPQLVQSAVSIAHAPRVNYMHNYVALPYYYGTERYYARPDVAGICTTVRASLDALDHETGFAQAFKGRRVLVKPNLVTVMFHCGYALDEIPQTTDPRVLDALIAYLHELGCDITIVEGTGKGVSTMQYFRDTGIFKIAKRYGTGLVALEEQPMEHYLVPKAEVQKDVYVPRIFGEVIRGEALYVSVPKMKTNLYTEVTLGFKNAMGTLSGNMRYRNHSWQIQSKLTDLLYLFKPDLTVIDGIIGGEGGTPGPVDPVKAGMVVSGTNSVEVDRVTTRMMGFDPSRIALMQEAAKRGFGDKDCTVLGEERVVPFRKADCSYLSERFRKNFPHVRYFVGHTSSRAPRVERFEDVTPELVVQMENACKGGCLATMSMFAEMVAKGSKGGQDVEFGAVLGNGCEVDGKRYWFDWTGKAYDTEALAALGCKNLLAFGSCTEPAAGVCTGHATGCCNVGNVLSLLMLKSGASAPMISLQNDSMGYLLWGMWKKYFAIRKVLKSGERVEIPFDATDDRIFAIPPLSPEDAEKDWIHVPMEKADPAEIRRNLRANKMISFG